MLITGFRRVGYHSTDDLRFDVIVATGEQVSIYPSKSDTTKASLLCQSRHCRTSGAVSLPMDSAHASVTDHHQQEQLAPAGTGEL